MFTRRNYIIVGLLIGIITFGVAMLFGPGVAVWVADVQARATLIGGLALFIGEPIKWVLLNPLPGAILAALAWPLVLLWLLLLFIMLIVGFGSPAAQDVRRQF